MSVMIWNPEWETGVDLIDQQHRQLLAQLEKLFRAIHENNAGDRLPGLLAFLAGYVETHFSTEEHHMQATGYLGLAGHKAIHDEMRSQVVQLVDRFSKDPTVMTEEVIDFLTDWLVNHIDHEDRRMAHHLIRFDAKNSGLRP